MRPASANGIARVIAAAMVILGTHAAADQTTSPAGDRWAPVRFLIGTWEGTAEGRAGSGTVKRQYRFVLRGQFIEGRNTGTYPPQDRNPKGEVHENVDYVSYDRGRKRFVLRQFHVEGFVSEYVADDGARADRLSFTTESIENIATGWRARETYVLQGPDEFEETFELAEPGKGFEIYSRAKLKRVREPK